MERQREESSFRVVDRRRFRPDGEPAAEEAAGPDAGPAAEGPGAGAAPDPHGERPRAKPPGEARALPPPTFASFVDSLALSALAALGAGTEQPEGGAPGRPDLPLARHGIDLLGMLEQKTRGNLTDDEARLLEQTLFDLRMLFVRASSRPG
jgi:hypothetical protein